MELLTVAVFLLIAVISSKKVRRKVANFIENGIPVISKFLVVLIIVGLLVGCVVGVFVLIS